jgi:tetratricopeptide (TPR) repeat protein/TolB-like protein
LDTPRNDDPVGQVYLHYQVTERLGAGGMGVVYRATDLKLKRTVALKFLPATQSVSEPAKQRFMREAMAASAVDHPNIGTLHAVEETPDGLLFLVMTCYEGPTLSKRMANGPLPADEAVAIALQIAEGLKEAHKRGVVHRDIKPGNIIFNPQGIAKILDFGLAKLQDSEELTTPGTTLGTASYMAPEQAMGQPADTRADLWSVGVVLYEMLIGSKPFSGSDLRSTIYAVVSKEPVRIADLPAPLQKVLHQSLQKDPQLRYQDAQEMIHDLEAARGLRIPTQSEMASAARPKPKPRQGFPARLRISRRLGWILAAVGCLLLVSILAVRYFRRPPAPIAIGKRMVVLPLTISAPDAAKSASLQALADGLRSEIIDSLAGREGANQGVLIVPLSQMDAQHVTDPATAHSALGADLALTGSVTASGSQLRVVLTTVDAANSQVLNSELIEGDSGSLSALSATMARTAAGMLGLKLSTPSTHDDELAGLAPAAASGYLESVGHLDRASAKPGELDLAIDGFQKTIQAAPNFAPAYAQLANCYGMRFRTTKDAGALAQAAAIAAHAGQIDGQSPEVLLALGQVRLFQGKYPDAVASFQRVLALDNRSDAAFRGLATAYAATGLPAQAEDAWQKAIAVHPNSVDDYNQLGTFEWDRGNYAKAAEQLRKALSLAPANTNIMSNLGGVLLMTGALDESRKVLQESIRLAPNYASYSNLGNLDLKQGRYAEAAADYEKALELNKSDYQVWSNLAVAYSQTPGQQARAKDGFLQAAKMCREALKTNPNDPEMLSDLAMFIASEGDERQEPLVLIEKALALGPQNTYVQFNAAETYESLGYRKEALDWLGKLIASGYPLDDINHSPVLADLIKDKRYTEMLAQRKK